MYAYIKGELAQVKGDSIVIDNQGIGYRIYTPLSVVEQLPALGSELKVYTYTHVKEDIFALYGFLTADDLNMFVMLLGVNGIGPKGALGILSALSADDLRFAILADDAKTIARSPGIGTKTASKLILELKDKVTLADTFERKVSQVEKTAAAGSSQTGIRNDAVEALTALGYNGAEAMRAVRQVELTDSITVEDVLRQALKHL